MSTTRTIVFSATFVAATLFSPLASAQSKADKPTVAPEIVRISLVQGDVRVSRGPKVEKASGSAWEKATVNLPLESGFSLVTGDGRAEIEFEDASTIYLAPNSALTLNDLTSVSSVPDSSLTLLTGTVTLNIRTSVAGEHFLLQTPVGRVRVGYPGNAIERVDSYLDAMAITTYRDAPDDPYGMNKGARVFPTTVLYRKGVSPEVVPVDADYATTFTAWDNWVAARVTDRDRDMTAVMRQANLSQPLPGLSDMASKGSFFSCKPFGTCWQPTATAAGLSQQSVSTTPKTYLAWEELEAFPCMPAAIHQLVEVDPGTHKRRILTTDFNVHLTGYQWAACHAGSWIRYHNAYAWVVGANRQYTGAVGWFTINGRTGFVPLHPLDTRGKTPVNLKEGVFLVDRKHTAELTAYTPGAPVQRLSDTPSFVRESEPSGLARADAPQLQAHTADALPGHTLVAHAGPTPVSAVLTFDHHTQSFMLAQQSIVDGRTRDSVKPFGGRIDHPDYASSAFRENIAAQRNFASNPSTSTLRTGNPAAGNGVSGLRQTSSAGNFSRVSSSASSSPSTGAGFRGGAAYSAPSPAPAPTTPVHN